MARILILKTFLLLFWGAFQMSNCLSARPEDAVGNFKVKRSLDDSPTDAPTEVGEIAENKTELYLFNDTMENNTSEVVTVDYSYLDKDFLTCGLIYLEPELYEKRPDNTVYVARYGMVFNRSYYLIREDLLFICPDNLTTPSPAPLDPQGHIGIISLVGMSISVICLALHIILYFTIRTDKKLPGRCLLSLCIALLLAYSLMLVQQAVENRELCRVVGMVMAYFFLAAFFWMNVFSYDVWRSIRLATTKLRLTADRPMMVRFARYSVYAWGSPLLISILSIIIHHSTSNPKFHLTFHKEICWYSQKQGLALYFVGPLFTLLGLNILLTASSFYMISSAAMQSSCGKDSLDLRARLCLSLKLGSSMGIMWIFGVLAVLTKEVSLWYIFAICSALQGVFIFLSFTVSERNRKKCKKALQGQKSSTTATQSSSNHVTSI